MAAATTTRGSGAHDDAAILRIIEGAYSALNATNVFRGMRIAR